MGLTAEQLRESLDAIAAREPLMAAAVAHVGYPEPRIREPGYETLLRTIVGQQVSVAAAASIWTCPWSAATAWRGLWRSGRWRRSRRRRSS